MGEDEVHDVSGLTGVLLDKQFVAYWSLQLALREQLHEFMSWGEGCACHESLLTQHRSSEQALRAEVRCPPDVPCRCPLMGCRAPEIA
eukprot:4804384-Amphidinium_carterae.1